MRKPGFLAILLAGCSPQPDADVAPPALRRLTQQQYQNAIRDLVAPDVYVAPALDASVLGPEDTLTMATRDGAAALGLDDVGSIEAGKRADLVRLDIDDAAFVPVTSTAELIAHLAWSAGSRHVTDVWVQGRQVVADRRCTTIDEAEARAEGQQRGLRLARESGT